MVKKRFLALLLALCLLAGCGPDLRGYPRVELASRVMAEQTLTIDVPREADPLTVSAVTQLCAAVMELSGGAVTLNPIYSNSPANALQGGATNLALMESGDLIEADPSMSFLEWPFLLEGPEQYLTVMGAEDGPVRGSGSLREALGGEVIGLWYGGRYGILSRGTFYEEIGFSGSTLGVLSGLSGSGYFSAQSIGADQGAAAVVTGGPEKLLDLLAGAGVKSLEYPLWQLDGEAFPEGVKYVEDTGHRVRGLWLVLGTGTVDQETADLLRAAAAYVPQPAREARAGAEASLLEAMTAADIQVRQGEYTALHHAAREYFRKSYRDLGCSQRSWERLAEILW